MGRGNVSGAREREKSESMSVESRPRGWSFNISPLLLLACPMHACGGLIFAGRL